MVAVIKPLCLCVSEASSSSAGHVSTDKTDNLTHLHLVSPSTIASVTKPTLGLHYTNVTPHPSAAAKISGIPEPSSIPPFILSISERGLAETEEDVPLCAFCVCCISGASANTLLCCYSASPLPAPVHRFAVKLLFFCCKLLRAS